MKYVHGDEVWRLESLDEQRCDEDDTFMQRTSIESISCRCRVGIKRDVG